MPKIDTSGWDKFKMEARRVKYLYRVTRERAEELVAAAARGNCEVCGSKPDRGKTKLCIDHNHRTHRVRGLLCHNCNLVIGLTKEQPARLESLAEYLRARDNG